MPSLSDMTSSGPVVLVDPGVLRDIALSLDGDWSPDAESDLRRQEELIAAAQLRLYGDRDRSGWMLLTTAGPSRKLLEDPNNRWSIGFIGVIEEFSDAPAQVELDALESMLSDEGVDEEHAHLLACAYLSEFVRIVITNDERAYRRSRAEDLPDHLQFMTVGEASEKLAIAPGEKPPMAPPGREDVDGSDAWWVP